MVNWVQGMTGTRKKPENPIPFAIIAAIGGKCGLAGRY
jgi:hypothetical protein